VYNKFWSRFFAVVSMIVGVLVFAGVAIYFGSEHHHKLKYILAQWCFVTYCCGCASFFSYVAVIAAHGPIEPDSS